MSLALKSGTKPVYVILQAFPLHQESETQSCFDAPLEAAKK